MWERATEGLERAGVERILDGDRHGIVGTPRGLRRIGVGVARRDDGDARSRDRAHREHGLTTCFADGDDGDATS